MINKEDLIKYKKLLSEEFISISESEKTTEEKAFIDFVIELLLENEEASDLVRSYFSTTQGSRKIEIDGYGYKDEDETFVLFLSRYDTEDELRTITQTEINQLQRFMEAFVESSLSKYIQNNVEFSSNGKEIANELLRKYTFDHILKFKFYIFTNSRLSDRVDSIIPKPIQGKKLEIDVWDIDRIYNSDANNREKEEIIIEINEGLPCIKAFEDKEAGYSSYLSVISGELLAKAYDKYNSRLLEKNVRDFLTFSGKVNKGIRGTIKNKPEFFFTYNNGIATTAKEVEVKKTNEGTRIVKIIGFQIINGGQTTASIFFTKFKDKADLSKVFVPMKLTVLNVSENTEEIIEKISRFSNTQNKVTDADFFSNSPFHRYFKEMSEKYLAPAVNGKQRQTLWFYERTKSSYRTAKLRLTKAQIEVFETQKPKNQVISKSDLAKYYTVFDCMPNVAAMGSVHYLKKFAGDITKYKDIKTEVNEYFFKKSVAMAIIFKETTLLVKNQEWHESGISYSSSIVYYTIAKLMYTIRTKLPNKTIDFMQIWNRQTMSQELIATLIDLSKKTYDFLNSKDREIEAVFNWSRSNKCWDRFKEYSFELSVGLCASLIKTDIEEEYIRRARKDQGEDLTINAESYVISKGISFWRKLFEVAELSVDITYIDRMDLEAVANFYSTRKAPYKFSEIAKRLLAFIDRCNEVSLDTTELLKNYSEDPKDKELIND